jgi:hypothetical protein
MEKKESSSQKFIVFIEYNCGYAPWGKTSREDEWTVYETNVHPKIGDGFGGGCGGGMHPSESCDEPDSQGKLCNEKGKITKIEEYSAKRAMELGLKV